MGLIKKNYVVKDLGIELPEVYAQITNIVVDKSGAAHSVFAVQQTRADIGNKKNLDTISYSCVVDKDLPTYRQIYEKAKDEIFVGWEDDIVE